VSGSNDLGELLRVGVGQSFDSCQITLRAMKSQERRHGEVTRLESTGDIPERCRSEKGYLSASGESAVAES
jgi:hypothetical protein